MQEIHIFGPICSIIKQSYAKTSPSKGAIWDEFSEQHQHQSIQKIPFLMPNFLVQIRCRFHEHFCRTNQLKQTKQLISPVLINEMKMLRSIILCRLQIAYPF